ncbi:tetratricopeptide repeat protein [Rhizobium sp. TH2]|uniref:adenylate/guanylate cyclase domain-containing protein n=1 Tax=Rhizobium sp. TH2 TaxID=2775403 RepID=UPI002156FB02|nr:adenylate/guanylate cyclase domain-containing protein [Rhizobium sp. TH2]UVC10204.1 tetratricopeptide repeat protein [Rhizobium sp. TH2]
MAESRKLAAILAADVVGFSRLAGADEDRTLARLRTLRSDLIDPTVAVHGGRIVKRTGDGAIIEFRSVVDAVRCAIEIQSAMVERNFGLPENRRIEFRVGIHLGDVVEESDGDLMGDGVNIAARLEGVATPGDICLSEDAYRQVRARLDLAVSDLGEATLKNIAEPIRIYSVHCGGTARPRPAVQAEAVPEANPQPPEKPSIAVLAFNNMSGDAEQEYFSDGISEDIITDLSKLAELHVIARNSSFVYKASPVSIPEVARALGVRYVLEGSVRKAGNRVRVTAQLIDSIGGGHVWANRFDRDLSDIFAIQDELTREIVEALKLKLIAPKAGSGAQRPPIDVEAYELFLRAREQAWLHTRSSNAFALELLQRAIHLSPFYAAAHAQMAFIHANGYIMASSDDPDKSLERALEIATRAVEMDPDEPQAHFALSVAATWSRDLDRALVEARCCLALSPNSAEGHLAMGNVLKFSGDPSGALEILDAYVRLDPLCPEIALYFIAEARFALGEYETVVKVLKQRLDRNPNSETSYALLASSYGHLGRMDEAKAAWGQVFKINPGFSIERRRRILPFRNPEDFERRVDGLRKAGIVE